ncbi:MAG: hypothetical protein Q7T82_00050, partial [Armatimonadota bacterium]|nr:hypothetical protein [Armatimonadota bacterium]
TIAWAKTFQDGTSLPIQYPLTGKIVSRTFPSAPSPYGPCFYIQEQNRTAGIRVASATPPDPGAIVRITGGTMATVGGERVINDPTSVEQTGTYTVYPLGTNHKLLGGGRLNQYTPAVGYAYGVSNTGTLVRVFGKVKSVGANCFYLEDGSGVNSTEDGNPRPWPVGGVCDLGAYERQQ